MRRQGEEGAALLSVLLLVAVMAVLAAASLEQLKLSTKLATNGAAIEQARSYAFAAESLARFRIGDLLQRDQSRTTLVGNWRATPTDFPIDGGLASARIDDGGNCFNLNSLVEQAEDGRLTARPVATLQFQRLLALVEVPAREATAVAAAAVDWIDSDSQPVPGGAEDLAYGAAKPVAYRTANVLMSDVSELRAVAGVTPELYSRARPFICALPVTDLSAINVNTIGPEQAPLLSMLLPALDVSQARNAIGARPATGFAGVADFFALPQLSSTAAATDGARNQIVQVTRWFDIRFVIELADAQLEENALFDARERPAKLVRRSYGEPS